MKDVQLTVKIEIIFEIESVLIFKKLSKEI